MSHTCRHALRLMAGGYLGALALTAGPAALAQGGPVYTDASAPIPLRVADVMARMTLEEKIAQIRAAWAARAEMIAKDVDPLAFDAKRASAAFPDGIGHVTRPSDKRGVPGVSGAAGGTAARWRTPAETVAFINALQRWAIEDTRLGIPVLLHEESLLGYMATEATMFPQAIALAGSFDTDPMCRVQAQIARETRARGVPLVLSPVVDIERDPRWGRIEETWGEAPYLVAEMAVAAVEGLQGPGKFERLADGNVFATLKHMTGHGQPESGNNVVPVQIAERELRENFFPPFRAVVERCSIGAVMPSYNEIDGTPSHANAWLLGTVLRGEWGFDGIIASDYGGVDELATLHHVARDLEDAAHQALLAGIDSELPEGMAFATLAAAVRAGRIPQALVDTACARMLTFKFRCGLFENPYGDAALAEAVTGNAEARALALEAARKSLRLLTNSGVLPLDRTSMGRVAVIGPNHAIARLGGYSSVPRQTVSLIDEAVDVAEALLGDINRGAKLPVSVVRNAGQIPLFYNHKPSARRGYLFDDKTPLLAFGHGLSYTSFAISPPHTARPRFTRDEDVTATITATNTGQRAGDEVVQLYVTRSLLSVSRPVLELKGFARVTLAPGESRIITFSIPPSQIAVWDENLTETNPPCPLWLWAVASSTKLSSLDVEIV